MNVINFFNPWIYIDVKGKTLVHHIDKSFASSSSSISDDLLGADHE